MNIIFFQVVLIVAVVLYARVFAIAADEIITELREIKERLP